MRIVAGVYGGRKLNVPKGRDIRPTSDKIRGAIFNMLQSRDAVVGKRVLDGFCGTGALGLEALSRGASHCTFYDKARSSLDLTQENAALLHVDDEQASFRVQNTVKIPPRSDQSYPFDLVLLDPPYHQGLIVDAIQALDCGGWLSQEAYIVCESERGLSLVVDGFSMESVKTYGEITVSLLQKSI